MLDSARWTRINELFHAALAKPAAERAAFLSAQCGGDAALRTEMESLLAAHREEQTGLLTGAVAVGSRLGDYEVTDFIAEGGMGEVYRARDAKLGRDVAIKILPRIFSSDPERLARFEREARMLAALNHPNIGAIYGVEEAEGVRALVLELVEGDTLADRLQRGAVPVSEALTMARQIADALDAAHEKGIIHRDLKPANIKITPDGVVKVLDFGLAKMGAAAGAGRPDLSRSPTLTEGGTGDGVILGTAAYMSPEQARGKPLDKRTDIWSFGCVLYEMLAGRQAISGDTVSDTIVAILEREPEWKALPDTTPASVRRLLQRCLEKDPRQRLRDIGDVRLELDHALAVGLHPPSVEGSVPLVDARRGADSPRSPTVAGGMTDQAVVPKKPSRAWQRMAAAVVLVALVGGALLWRARFVGVGSSEIRSIAVIPLQNLSGDAGQEYFSDGTTEALISRLAQIHTLEVISRTSVMRYKGTTKPLQEIGRELGVDAIVEGSVQRAGGRVRVTAQLIRVSTDKHLWSGAYEREMADVLKLQADAAVAIAQEIQAYVTQEERRRLASAPRVEPAAYEEYLLGHHSLLPGDQVTSKQAVEHFQRAIKLQPDYADAYAGLSIALNNVRDVSAARVAAERALDLDPDVSEAHSAMAGIRSAEWDWHDAEKEYRRALELDPNSLDGCVCYSTLLRMLGRFPQALSIIERAASRDPLSSAVQDEYGIILYFLRKYEEAIPRFQRAVELDGRNRLAIYMLSLTYEKVGRPKDALALVDRPEFRPSAELGLAFASLGRRTDALNIVASLDKPGSQPDGVTIAALFFVLGDNDRGFQWLTRAFEERQGRARFVKFHPMFDNVRSDPRLAALVATLKIPD